MDDQTESCVAFFDALRQGNLELLRTIINSEYDINAKDGNKTPPLHVATSQSNLRTLIWLLNQKSVDKNAEDEDGYTALMRACALKLDFEFIEVLLTYGCDVNLTESNGLSALHLAVRDGNEPLVKLLMDYGADVNLFTENNFETPLIEAIKNKLFNLVAVLLYHNNFGSTLHNLNLSFNNYKYFWVLLNLSEPLLDLLLPWIDMRHKRLLAECNIPTLRKIWNAQSKQDRVKFSTWCLKCIDSSEFKEDIIYVMRNIFTKNFAASQRPCSFFHQLFEDEDLSDLMYYPKTSQYFLQVLTSASYTRYTGKILNETDQFIADYLKIFLSNFNEIVLKVLYFLTLTLYPSATLAVLEDMNVKITGSSGDLTSAEQLDWWKGGVQEIAALWKKRAEEKLERIYYFECVYYPRYRQDLRRKAEEKLPNYDLVCDQINGVLSKFVNTDDSKPPSLVELSRNTVRRSVDAKSKSMCDSAEEHFPFKYANDIKRLPIPKIIHDILLFRMPIYNVSTYLNNMP